MLSPRCTLKLVDLSLPVRLGCLPDEQAVPQEVRISFEIQFAQAPEACHSDQLVDTLCYAELSELIRSYSSSSTFRTVEKLGAGCFEILQARIPSDAGARLVLHKVKPPVTSLVGGVFFQLENEKWR